MAWNISGWSQGKTRTPLTYNLRAGQFRGMGKARYIPSTTIINNNIFGNMRSGCCNSSYDYYNSGCCGGGSSTPSWMNWMMGIGMGSSLIGNILDMFGIGKAKDAGDADAPTDNKPAEDPYAKDWTELQNLYKGKGTFAHIGNEYICLLSNGKYLKDSTPSGLMTKIQNELTTPTPTSVAPTASSTASGSSDGQGGTIATLADGFNNITWSSFDIKSLNDDKTSPINLSGTNDTTCSTDLGTNVKAPKIITVTSGNKTYKFELVDDASKVVNGQPTYKCVSTTANTTLSANQIQVYILKSDGTFYQNSDCAGYGIGLGSVISSS